MHLAAPDLTNEVGGEGLDLRRVTQPTGMNRASREPGRPARSPHRSPPVVAEDHVMSMSGSWSRSVEENRAHVVERGDHPASGAKVRQPACAAEPSGTAIGNAPACRSRAGSHNR